LASDDVQPALRFEPALARSAGARARKIDNNLSHLIRRCAMTTDERIQQAAKKYRNWGKWGKDDQLGTLN
jgi:hypothetical protein